MVADFCYIRLVAFLNGVFVGVVVGGCAYALSECR